MMTAAAMQTFTSLQTVDSVEIRFAWLITVRSRVARFASAFPTDYIAFRAVIALTLVSTVRTPLLRWTLYNNLNKSITKCFEV